MKIKALSLKQFRNIQQETLNFGDHLNVFVGDNGQGKTNILEAIVFLSSGRSFRVNDDTLLIQSGLEFAEINASIEASSLKHLRAIISQFGKYLKVNETVVSRLSDFIGHCNVVLFQPDDLQFFTQAPRKRRRDIDYELGKLSQRYTQALSKAMQLIQERNAALKSSKVDDTYLSVLNDKIAEESVVIINERWFMLDSLNPKICHYYEKLSGTKANIVFSYETFVQRNDESLKDAILKKMDENTKRDRDFKMTHVGIHRDDFVFRIDEVPVVHRLSQGQRRLLIVAYKLSIIEQIYEKTHTYPIFCMDDLLSELDEERRLKVLTMLPEMLQCFVTTTDIQFLNGYDKNIKIFPVSNGTVKGGQ